MNKLDIERNVVDHFKNIFDENVTFMGICKKNRYLFATSKDRNFKIFDIVKITEKCLLGKTEAENEDIMLSVKSTDRTTSVDSALIYKKKNFDDNIIVKILIDRKSEYLFT